MAEIFGFLADLASNNDREWFAANRARYEAARETFEALLASIIASLSIHDETISLVSPKQAAFRLHRDLRFTKDKTPYKLAFSAFVSGYDRRSAYPGYYLRIEPGATMMAAGLHSPGKSTLAAIRAALLKDHGWLTRISGDLAGRFPGGLGGDRLKRVPSGFPADHAASDFLRHKGFVVSQPFSDKSALSADLPQLAAESFAAAVPLNNALARYVVPEHAGRQ